MRVNELHVVVMPRPAVDRRADMELGAPQPLLIGDHLSYFVRCFSPSLRSCAPRRKARWPKGRPWVLN